MVRSCFDSVAAVRAAVGRDLGVTDWLAMTQDRIDGLADATGDRQWIHIDPARVARGPFGACIAHGYRTQALASMFLVQLVRHGRVGMVASDGRDRVRFPALVKVGARIRAPAEAGAAAAIPHAGVRVTVGGVTEIEGSRKPGCSVGTVSRLYSAPGARRPGSGGVAPASALTPA